MSSEDSFDPPNREYPNRRYGITVRIMISTLIVLFVVILLVILLHTYAGWISRQPVRLPRRRIVPRRRRFHFTGQEPARLRNVGLDSAVIETLPLFHYKPQNFIDGLDCAVCLCELKENDTGRLLPNCRHSFHVDCIDMWFRSHSTCPVCRTDAQPEQPVPAEIL